MAATVSSAWAKPGAWALDSEEHEEELKREIDHHKPPFTAAPEPPAAEFPSLAAAASAKPKKKNKGQTVSLAEFSNYGAGPKRVPSAEPQRLTQDELLMLPTGPRERTAEELDRNRLGGGFRNYGGDRESSRVRVSDRNRERERDSGPSRADEVDDWSKTKKMSSFGPDRSERREKVGFFNSSRADEVDNWASNKSFAPTSDPPRRERRMGFESYSNGSGPDADNWLKKEDRAVDSDTWGRRKEDRAVDSDTWGRRKEDRVVDSDNWGRKKEESSNGNADGAVARPRLNLQPRTLPINNGQGQTQTPTEGGKPKGSNPFGEARPREEVLKEKGKDWKEIDEKLEAVKIKDKEVGSEKGEGFNRRKGFGMGRVESGDDRTVKTWRKPESNDAVPPPSSAEKTENNAEMVENSESTEKLAEEN